MEYKISFSKGLFEAIFNGYWKEIKKFNFAFVVYEFFYLEKIFQFLEQKI